MPKPTVYIETSVLSYLTARPSRDIIVAGQQQITSEWWENSKDGYTLFVSAVVVEEASSGNVEAAERRLESISEVDVLEVTDNAIQLAALLIQKRAMPAKAVQDALHIAIASVNRIQYLLTWNYKHIANATMREAINQICREAGYTAPVICTPAELGGENVG
ncbi:MAG: type II toxin-antitoxin system VapC family toxin [Chloroflexi bacterium]|nr:type II toxin-antitoxin system VapC family toxin [Chloroflexota bacterium]